MRTHLLSAFFSIAIALLSASPSVAGQLLVGAATADITPEGPVALRGQFHLRISKSVETPLSAGVVALESRNGDQSLDAMAELARRIVQAVDDTYEAVKDDRHSSVPLVHHVEAVRLPMRLVTEAEYKQAKAGQQSAADAIAKDPKAADRSHTAMRWHGRTVERFEAQKDDPKPLHEMELHVVRIGDAVICTNQFELFTDYGIQMKARSKAVQTFVVQLAGAGTYLPTERAVRGGSYSAIVQSNRVGPEGGQVLVDKTVAAIDAVFAPRK